MQTIKFSGKLFIEKKAIAQLDENQLASINGGAASSSKASNTCSCTYTCPPTSGCPCGCKE